jgi:hypothetical protein
VSGTGNQRGLALIVGIVSMVDLENPIQRQFSMVQVPLVDSPEWNGAKLESDGSPAATAVDRGRRSV